MAGFIGPALPPHLRNDQTNLNENESTVVTCNRMNEDNLIFGPTLPLHLKNRLSNKSVDTHANERKLEVIPVLLQHLNDKSLGDSSNSNCKCYAPSEHSLSPLVAKKSPHQSYEIESNIGSALPACLCNQPPPQSSGNESGIELPMGHLNPNSLKHVHMKRICRKENDVSRVCNIRCEHEEDDGSVLVLTADSSDEEFGEQPEDEIYGPALPPSQKLSAIMLGPKLPPGFKGVGGDVNNIVGPTMPPGILGPSLPPGFKVSEDVTKQNTLDGVLEDRHTSESDEDVVGPVPKESGRNNFIQKQLEIRALQMRCNFAGDDKSDKDGAPKRESWMLELPPERAAQFGLGPRQFRAREKVDLGDRSVWTDTPADNELKKHCKVEVAVGSSKQLKQLAIIERDIAMQREANHYAHKRGEKSLLDSHQERLKKKRKKDKESGNRPERRPFDRDTDLHTNRFDDAQKKAIFNKARLLNDRFSAGQSKFL